MKQIDDRHLIQINLNLLTIKFISILHNIVGEIDENYEFNEIILLSY